MQVKPREYAGARDDAAFWQRARLRREPARARWYVPGIVVAAALSVPWYWRGEPALIAGLPAWVWGTLACSAVISTLVGTAALFWWQDDDDPADARADESRRDEDASS